MEEPEYNSTILNLGNRRKSERGEQEHFLIPVWNLVPILSSSSSLPSHYTHYDI
jgi:hypothetical protein